MIPRIRGRIGEISEPKELQGKFAFEVSIWSFDGEKQLSDPIGPYGPFETHAEAQAEMKNVVRMISEAIEKNETGKLSGSYLDMKNGGILRSWN